VICGESGLLAAAINGTGVRVLSRNPTFLPAPASILASDGALLILKFVTDHSRSNFFFFEFSSDPLAFVYGLPSPGDLSPCQSFLTNRYAILLNNMQERKDGPKSLSDVRPRHHGIDTRQVKA
jgi:hypothetical protein